MALFAVGQVQIHLRVARVAPRGHQLHASGADAAALKHRLLSIIVSAAAAAAAPIHFSASHVRWARMERLACDGFIRPSA